MTTKIRVLIFFLIAFAFVNADASEIKKLAILDFYSLNVSSADSIIITEMIRSKASAVKAFNVMQKKEIDKILQEKEININGNSQLEQLCYIGKLFNADIILTGKIEKQDKIYNINILFVDVGNKKLLYEYDVFMPIIEISEGTVIIIENSTGKIMEALKQGYFSFEELNKSLEKIFSRIIVPEEGKEPEANKEEITTETKQEKNINAAMFSLMLPGLGQVYKGNREKGTSVMLRWGVSMGITIGSYMLAGKSYSEYEDATSITDLQEYWNTAMFFDTLTAIAGLNAIGNWIYAIVDAACAKEKINDSRKNKVDFSLNKNGEIKIAYEIPLR